MSDQTPPIFGHCAFGQHEWASTDLKQQVCKCGEITVIRTTEIDALTARCEALEGELETERIISASRLTTGAIDVKVIEAYQARCEALTAERDTANKAACVAHVEFTRDALARIRAERQDEIDALRSSCQHLEQAIRVVLPNVESYDDACDAAVQALWAILESSDKAIPPTDENRVSFAAGYSTLVDEHAALLKDMRELMSQAYLACGDMQDDIVERAVLRLGLDPFEISKIPEGEDRD